MVVSTTQVEILLNNCLMNTIQEFLFRNLVCVWRKSAKTWIRKKLKNPSLYYNFFLFISVLAILIRTLCSLSKRKKSACLTLTCKNVVSKEWEHFLIHSFLSVTGLEYLDCANGGKKLDPFKFHVNNENNVLLLSTF